MKKTGVPSVKEMGGGVYLATAGKGSNLRTDAEKGKPIPNKTEEKNSKWKIQAHLILIR